MSNSCKYYTERTLGWMLNNKIIVLLSLLSFSLFVSTLVLAGQKNGLSGELEECRNSLTTPVPTTVTAEPDTVPTEETTATTSEAPVLTEETTVPTEETTVPTEETTVPTEETTVPTEVTTTVTESTPVPPEDVPDKEEVHGGTGGNKLLQILGGASD